MSPIKTNLSDDNLGWKAFFALLMLLQCIAIGVMWRTYDLLQETSLRSEKNQIKIDEIVFPTLVELKSYHRLKQ